MGLLVDSAEDDLDALGWIAKYCEQGYTRAARIHPEWPSIEVNHDMLVTFSELGDRVFKRHFEEPDFITRIACLVALANAHPPFKLWRDRHPVSGTAERRDFFAKISCAVVEAAFCRFKPRPETGEKGVYRFRFGDTNSQRRFLAYLKLMDVGEVTVISTNVRDNEAARKEEESLRILARDIMAITEFIRNHLAFELGAVYADLAPRELPEDVES